MPRGPKHRKHYYGGSSATHYTAGFTPSELIKAEGVQVGGQFHQQAVLAGGFEKSTADKINAKQKATVNKKAPGFAP